MAQGNASGSRFGFVGIGGATKNAPEPATQAALSPKEIAYCGEVAGTLNLPEEVVVAFAQALPAYSGEIFFTQRLEKLGIIPEGSGAVVTLGDAVNMGIPAQTMAAILTTCRPFPITDGSQTFLDHMVQQGMINESQRDSALVESVQNSQSTVQYVIDSNLAKTDEVMEALAAFSGMEVASRSDLSGGPMEGAPEALALSIIMDCLLWEPNGAGPVLLSERPVMDFVVDAVEAHLGARPEVRLISPRTFQFRLEKVDQSLRPKVESVAPPAPEPEPAPKKSGFGFGFGLSPAQPKAASMAPASGAPRPRGGVVSVSPDSIPRVSSAPSRPAPPAPQPRPQPAPSTPPPPMQPPTPAASATPSKEPTGGFRTVGQTSRRDTPMLPRTAAARAVERVVGEALERRATDIHLDPMRDHLRVRVRVDGLLHELYKVPPDMARELVARIKIMAEMDITEKRRSQDGQISMR
ncbi:MAG: Flp pilus assembly complex ATPase component TadA, partial [Myxococcales bacterium]|nr:Flp pilus assembly complex ATPase component TadA [Myxococcales bacterium]